MKYIINFEKAKKSLLLLLAIIMIIMVPVSRVEAKSYDYTVYGETIPAPDAYTWKNSVRGKDLGLDSLTGITALYYKNQKLYVVITGKIIITNQDLDVISQIESYKTDKGVVKIENPTSVFVTDDNHIYFTEEALGLVVELDENGQWVRTLTNPGITGLDKIKYQPSTVVVDNNGRIFIKAKSIYEGIIELDPEGNFTRFVGANMVIPDIGELIARKFATEEQISRMKLWLPTDYSDIAIDNENFLMATVKDNASVTPIRKLNSASVDILAKQKNVMAPMGDFAGAGTISTLTSIATSQDGRFAALDVVRNRIFVYSKDGLLLYILGGKGKQEGSLNSPVDMCFMEDEILVADLVSKSIEIFEPTPYGAMINAALIAQGEYDYKTAAEYWTQVYDIYPNSIVANMGLGNQALRDENFEAAMDYFKTCIMTEDYSSAYERVREEWLSNNLGKLLIGIIIFIIAINLLKRFLNKQKQTNDHYNNNKFILLMRKIRYTAFTWPGYVLSSPFKAFDDVKYENAGSTWFAVIIFVLFAWANLFKVKYSGFLVNTADTSKINVPLILISCVVPYLIFVVANWAVGTLIDGKGNLNQVFKITAYSMYPTVFCYVIGSLISRVIILNEVMFVLFLFYFPMAMFVFYCFVGIVMIHQFSFTKGVASVLLSIVAMAIIIFIIVLLATMISQFGNDIRQIWEEFSLYYL